MQKKIDVSAIAALARLELSDTEKHRLECEMAQFIEYASCLEQFPPEELCADLTLPLESLSFRDDVVCGKENNDAVSNAKSLLDGYVVVPITVGKESKK